MTWAKKQLLSFNKLITLNLFIILLMYPGIYKNVFGLFAIIVFTENSCNSTIQLLYNIHIYKNVTCVIKRLHVCRRHLLLMTRRRANTIRRVTECARARSRLSGRYSHLIRKLRCIVM